jgi:integrase/recombinase XerD
MHVSAQIVHSSISDTSTIDTQNDRLISLWLHGRPRSTVDAYRREVNRMLAHVGKPIAQLTLEDLQRFDDSLASLAPRTRARSLAATKSMLTFLRRAGLLAVDVGVALRSPRIPSDLTARILSRSEVRRLFRAARTPRDAALLQLLYHSAFRRAEICSIRWRDVSLDEETGDALISVIGKGDKRRTVRVNAAVWALAAALRRPEDAEDAPVFRGRGDQAISFSQLRNIVAGCGKRAKIGKPVSPHWLRHAHASHALDRGAPISLVRDTLGHASIATTGKYAHARPRESSGKYLGGV